MCLKTERAEGRREGYLQGSVCVVTDFTNLLTVATSIMQEE